MNSLKFAVLAAALFALASCSSSGMNSNLPRVPNPGNTTTTQSSVDTDMSVDEPDEDAGFSVLKHLNTSTTIGSTVDPINGDQNPYGLAIATTTSGKIQAGDLVICNFNDGANVQGTGTTIVALHPLPGSAPTRVAQDASLTGCDEVALAPNGNIWASAFAANDNPIVSPSGSILTTLPAGPWHHPFGEVFAPHAGPFGIAAFYESNATDGSIVRININPGPTFTFDIIATGFAVNNGVPGSILSPSGLAYDLKHDRLIIVDGTNNTVVSLRHVSTIPQGGIVVNANGTTFSGPFKHRARLVFSGSPLNGPISSALLWDGHIVVGNTLDPTGQNLMVELTLHGQLLDVKNVDTGVGGAIFGMVASGTTTSDTKLYFNDDNANATVLISR